MKIQDLFPMVTSTITVGFIFTVSAVHGTTLNGQTIKELNINNEIYNVTFVDGTYNSVYATEAPTFLGNYSGASVAVETILLSLDFQSLVPPNSQAGFFVPAAQRILNVGSDAGILVFDGPFWAEGLGCGVGGCGIGNARTNEFPVSSLSNTTFTRFTRVEETQSVPEPTSILGIITVVGLGFGSTLKRKPAQSKTK